MADTTPLLLSCPSEQKKNNVSSNSAAQLFQAIFVSFAWVFDSQQTFITVFTDSSPSWHSTGSNNSSSICSLPAEGWAWDRPPKASIISEWSLQCASSLVTGLPSSSYFLGCLLGGILLATLADSLLGRKNMLFFSCFGMSITGLLSAASPNVWVYSFLRFFTGFSRSTIGTSALVLSTELVGKSSRGEIGIIGFFFFTLGFLSLPATAYLNRNSSWRNLYLWTSSPCLIYSAMVYFLVRESPRWLLVKGRKEEAIETLESLNYTFSGFNISIEEDLDESPDVYSAMKLLFRKKWAMQRLAAIMAAGIGIGVVYYGMPLSLDSLGSNLYFSVSLNAISELPSSLIVFFLVGKINRRASVLGFTLASGLLSVWCVFLEGKAKLGIEVLSFFCACSAFDILLIYGLELFPTTVRNSALSMVRQALVLGGVIAPQLAASARTSGEDYMSFGAFGVLIAFCGLFVVLLPETRGSSIFDTLEEQEIRERNAGSV